MLFANNRLRCSTSIQFSTVLITCFAISFLGWGNALAQDQVGIYWDSLFTTNIGETATVPGATTGYVVLHDASGTGGIIAWEACIDIEGSGTLTGFDYQGQAINAGSGSCFAVGYTSPLPYSSAIVLATFQAIALEPGPLYITMKPEFNSSLPGQMSYIAADAPEDLVAMSTVTGEVNLAGLNGANLNLTTNVDLIDFFSGTIGDSLTQHIRIFNTADTPSVIDHGFVGICSSFSLPNGAGLVTIPANQFVDIEVVFVPEVERQVHCEIFFDFLVDPIAIQGSGEGLNNSYSIAGVTNWGDLLVDTVEDHAFTLSNTGNTSLQAHIVLPSACPAFVLIGGGYYTITPGNSVTFTVRFAPTSTGQQLCPLQLFDTGSQNLTLTGNGVAGLDWRAPTAISFGESYRNKATIITIPITNTSATPLRITASLGAGCAGFTILAGGGEEVFLNYEETHHVVVQLQSADTGSFFCTLDLGDVMPDVALSGTVIAGPATIEVSSSVLSFPPTTLGTTSDMDLFLRNVSSQNVTINVIPASNATEFIVPIGVGMHLMIPGEVVQVRVRFLSNTLGFQTKILYIGGGASPVQLVADSRPPIANCKAVPTSVNFGEAIAGAGSPQIIIVTNSTSQPVFIDPISTSPDVLLTGSPVNLLPGQQLLFNAWLNPASIGSVTGTILLSDSICAPVPVSGFNLLDPALLTVEPTSIDIATVPVATAVDREILVTNNGAADLPLDIKLLQPDYGFLIVSGGGAQLVAPGASHVIQIRFLAPVPSSFQTAVFLGDNYPIIPITASAATVVEDCEVSLSNLTFGGIATGTSSSQSVLITNHSGSDIMITPVSDSPQFQVTGQTFTILTGGSGSFEVTFSPSALGTYSGTISLNNSLCIDVSCYGQGLLIEDFSKDILGVYWEENFLDNNTFNHPSGSTFTGYLVMSDPGQSGGVSAWEAAIEIQGTAIVLGWTLLGDAINLGEGNEFVVGLASPLPFTTEVVLATLNVLNVDGSSVSEFHATPVLHPSVSGQMSWVAGSLPNILLPIHTLSGTSLIGSITPNQIIDPAWYLVTPEAIDIPAVEVGTQIDKTIVVSNIGPVALHFDIELLQPIYGFTIISGAGPQVIAPGQNHHIELRFICLSAATYATNISLGADLPLIPLDAIGVAAILDCDIADLFLEFGDVNLDSSRSRSIEVTNTTDIPMTITPASSSPYFVVDNSEVFFAAGESKSIQVVFTPVAVSLYNGVIDLGNALCESISCYGEGVIGEDFSADLLGIFFDPELTQSDVYAGSDELLTGYLVLSMPSQIGGVLAWECKVSVVGNALILGWSLEGDNINIGSGEEFVVGLASPLPFSQQTPLASFQVYNTHFADQTEFLVSPIRLASVPDQMSWIAASRPETLLPIHTLDGSDVVASISPDGVVALELPSPQAQLFGQQISLSWPAPDEAFDGSHVYRRLVGEEAVRLTEAPLSASGATLTYTDDATGLTPGSKVYYSYALLQDGVEKARSAEVEITVPTLPALATRLLPNVPNPFNPMTEIKFQLNKSGQVSLKIYDVTGRLVRELASGTLVSGPHSRVWQGRDATGRQVPSGTYYVRLVTQNNVDNRKIMLLK